MNVLERLLPVVLLVSALCVAAASSGCSNARSGAAEGATADNRPQPRAMSVRSEPAALRSLQVNQVFTGDLLPRRATAIMAEVNGTVLSIPPLGPLIQAEVNGRTYSEQLGVMPGQFVREGEVLVQLNPTELQLAVATAEANLAKARADLADLLAWERPEAIAQLTALRDEARARFDQAGSELNRQQQLIDRGAGTQQAFEQASLTVSTTKAMLDSQDALLRQALAGPTPEEIAIQQALVDQAEAELNQDRDRLSKVTIRAPFDGVITQFSADIGMQVGPGAGQIAELLDLRYLIAEIGIPERYMGRVEMEDLAEVAIAGSETPVPGMAISINGKVEPESRTFRVRVAIDNLDGRFKAGQFARVTMDFGTEEPTLTVPSRAIVLVEGQPAVFVVEDGHAHRRMVATGLFDGQFTEIVTGISAGDTVVVDDPTLLADGAAVIEATSP